MSGEVYAFAASFHPFPHRPRGPDGGPVCSHGNLEHPQGGVRCDRYGFLCVALTV